MTTINRPISHTATFHVYKDTFKPSRPWAADVSFPNQPGWKSWCYGFKTKTKLIEHIHAIAGNDAKIVDRPYLGN